jgi:hypothetical protein
MQTLKKYYPNAVGMRSHRNFFGQNIADLANQLGLRYDVSLFLWNTPFCQGYIDYNGMIRFAYMWEDGIHLDMGLSLNFHEVQLFSPGMKVLNVHPILIYLNAASEEHRRRVTSRYRDLTSAPRNEVDAEINHDVGLGTVWRALLAWLADNGVRTHCLRDAAAYRG